MAGTKKQSSPKAKPSPPKATGMKANGTPSKKGSTPPKNSTPKKPASKKGTTPVRAENNKKVSHKRMNSLPANHIFYESKIHKQFKKDYPVYRLSSKTTHTLSMVLNAFVGLICVKAKELNDTRNSVTINHNTIDVVLHSFLPADIYETVKNEIDAYLRKAQSGNFTKQDRQFSVGNKKLRNLLANSARGSRVSATAILSIGSFLRSITIELIDLAYQEMQNSQSGIKSGNRRETVFTIDLVNGIKKDEEIHHMFLKNHIIIPGVYNINGARGVHKTLVSKGARNTQALRLIKKTQKGEGCLRIARALFAKMVRQVQSNLKDSHFREFRFSGGSLLALQTFCESRLVNLFAGGNLICVESKRKTVQIRDLKLAVKLLEGNVAMNLNSLVNSKKEAKQLSAEH
jgi:histone H3/H4